MSLRRKSSATSLSRFARAQPLDAPGETLDFCNAFWGPGDGGVEVLFARMRGASRTIEELRDFLRERASIEEQYAKRLSGLATVTLGRDEIGDLRTSLDNLRRETTKQAEIHTQFAQIVRTVLDAHISRFLDKQLHHRKTVQAAVEAELKMIRTNKGYVQRAKEKYEANVTQLNALTAEAKVQQGRELEKINFKIERLQPSVHAGERDLANAARTLADIMGQWETTWKGFCDNCQDLEEERSELMMDVIFEYANAISIATVEDDKSCERLRLIIENFDPAKDMQHFVRNYGTGSTIPELPSITKLANGHPPSSIEHSTTRPANFRRVSQRQPGDGFYPAEKTGEDASANVRISGSGDEQQSPANGRSRWQSRQSTLLSAPPPGYQNASSSQQETTSSSVAAQPPVASFKDGAASSAQAGPSVKESEQTKPGPGGSAQHHDSQPASRADVGRTSLENNSASHSARSAGSTEHQTIALPSNPNPSVSPVVAKFVQQEIHGSRQGSGYGASSQSSASPTQSHRSKMSADGGYGDPQAQAAQVRSASPDTYVQPPQPLQSAIAYRAPGSSGGQSSSNVGGVPPQQPQQQQRPAVVDPYALQRQNSVVTQAVPPATYRGVPPVTQSPPPPPPAAGAYAVQMYPSHVAQPAAPSGYPPTYPHHQPQQQQPPPPPPPAPAHPYSQPSHPYAAQPQAPLPPPLPQGYTQPPPPDRSIVAAGGYGQTPAQMQSGYYVSPGLAQQPAQVTGGGNANVGGGYGHDRNAAPPPPAAPAPPPAAPRQEPPPTGQYTEDGRGVLFYVKAMYDYQATIEEEFDFQSGDIIAVTDTPEDGWWSGELLDEARRQPGRHVFPSNFVTLF
ncbi:hypothetical protein BXZ70DRAFT_930962 [Cristinia sonorae]|uniref:SH3 domain-containing protein n=1 Tax=Cristinia sonorae TaxID=1940300 RepID=A0A8K0US85_9AGAR|nr:hypothetical protein BXZ70DRAFT_930962 [Cristinia sonorae]